MPILQVCCQALTRLLPGTGPRYFVLTVNCYMIVCTGSYGEIHHLSFGFFWEGFMNGVFYFWALGPKPTGVRLVRPLGFTFAPFSLLMCEYVDDHFRS